jgi:hypothetical protein
MATAIVSGGRIIQILGGINTVLAADLGTTDLSATGRFVYGRFPEPPTLPFLAVDLEGIETDPNGPALQLFGRTATLHLEGWYTTIFSTPAGATVFGALMVNEVMGALENSHRTSGSTLAATALGIRELYVTQIRFHSTEINGHPVGHWTAKLVIVYALGAGI